MNMSVNVSVHRYTCMPKGVCACVYLISVFGSHMPLNLHYVFMVIASCDNITFNMESCNI